MEKDNQKFFIIFIFKNFKGHTLGIIILSLLQALLEVFSIIVLVACILNFFQENEIVFQNILMQKIMGSNFFSFEEIQEIILFLVLVYLSKNFFLILINWLKLNLCGKIYKELSVTTYRNILEKKVSFFTSFSTGDYAQSVISETDFVKEILICYATIFTEIVIIFCIFLILFFQDSLLSFNIISLIILGVIIYSIILRKINNYLGSKRQKNSINIFNSILESILFIKLIKLKNKYSYFTSKIDLLVSNIYKVNRDFSTIHYSSHILLESFVIIVLYFSTFSLLDTLIYESTDIAKVFFLIIVSLRFIPSFSIILGSLSTIQYGKAAVNKISHFLKSFKIEEEFNCLNIKFKNFEISNVSYKYKNNDDYTLNNINLTISEPSLIGIKGINGSGKTTLLNIIAGLIQPEKGYLLLDGKNIYDNDELLFNWRNLIGYVDQNKKFCSQTVYEVIAFGIQKDNIDKHKVSKCLEKVGLLNYFNNLPNGLNADIGENGTNLSSGQVQRLSIARSLYDDPKVLVFDEITNNLDKDSKVLIIKLLNNLKKSNIIFISTHSETILENCDEIIAL